MPLIRSVTFTILLNLWGAIIPIIYSPVFFTRNANLADRGAKAWSIGAIWLLKVLCGIDYEIRGREKLPKGACIIACKHQSAWETIVMHLVLNHPVYAYKKELEKIPFYGWYLKVMSGIKINRKGGASALKDLIKQAKKYLAKGQKIVLFPQGTRVPTNGSVEKYPYQAGVTALYLSCGVAVVPAALNSGKFWPKSGVKKSGKIILEFLEPIEPGLSKQEFSQRLEQAIEAKSNQL
ncbi:MAG: 1-acyl-sn-glycerol-3-phosphate acyltransferase [Proteobacteria bacterium]|nr:1-acyl-sn-glycerol-3-phosphate acyltransferase [Pseudomonadota bacterium]